MMSVETNKAVVLRFNKEFLELGKTDILGEIVADDFINHTASGNVPNNVTGLIQFVKMLHQGFPDIQVQIHEQIAENDIVASRKTIRGTHLGEIMGHQPTGKKVTINVMDFVRIKDGKYTDHWGQNNIMQVIEQL